MSYIQIVITLLLAQHVPACSAVTDTISTGQTLTIHDKLVSKNGRYAFGFSEAGNNSSKNTSNWYLGIWFNSVSKFTQAWVADRDNPIKSPVSLELKTSHDGNLIVFNRSTNFVIWSTLAKISENNTIAMLLNSGNLILRTALNTSDILWQSFDHPTDTYFPGAKLGWNKVTGLNHRLVSRKNSISPATGVYCYEMDPSGINQIVIESLNSSTPYWSTGVWNGRYFASAPVGANKYMNMSFVDNALEKYYTFVLQDETIILYHYLDSTGQLKSLIWNKPLQDWLIGFSEPKSCDVYATCGPYTICNDDASPHCNCMRGFTIKSPEDWLLDDRTGGCFRDTPLDCIMNESTKSSTDKFYPAPCVSFIQSTHKIEDAKSIGECAQVCLYNCSCTAYFFSNGGCSIWHEDLLNIKQMQCNSTMDPNGETLYIRLAAKDVQSSNKKSKLGRLLVYEHMPNRSLDIHLFQSHTSVLKWRTRYQIALGVARGLSYLHVSCRECIIHCDIKPENILLSDSFIPKIADFGMAKFLGRDFSQVLTSMRETIGYLAPEWIGGVAITPKVDVYAYGMVLLEIISGRRNSCISCSCSSTHDIYYPVHVAQKILEEDVRSLVHHRLYEDVNLKEAKIACKVACWCIQDNEFDLPTMIEVVQILEGLLEINIPPMPRLLQTIVGSSYSSCS
ncbi:hypothetical protein ACP4OV_030495 [Aristida adscensionis]